MAEKHHKNPTADELNDTAEAVEISIKLNEWFKQYHAETDVTIVLLAIAYLLARLALSNGLDLKRFADIFAKTIATCVAIRQ